METKHIYSNSPRWIWIVLIWLGYGLVDAMQTVFVMRSEGMHHAWGKLFLTSVLSWLPWALATPLLMRLARRFPLAKRGAIVTWLGHIGGCAAMALATAAWLACLYFLLNPFAYAAGPGRFGYLLFEKFYSRGRAPRRCYAGIL